MNCKKPECHSCIVIPFELSCYDSLLYPLGAISDMEMQEHYDEFFEVKPHYFAAGTLSFTKV